MQNYNQHIVKDSNEARFALRALDILDEDVSRTLFVVNDTHQLVGTLTDGDIRRGLLNGLEISYPIQSFMNVNYRFLKEEDDNLALIKEYGSSGINLIPLINEDRQLIEIVDLKRIKTKLPLVALLMAGGKGERLKPLTELTPKPMLKIGEKPIIEHNIDRLIRYGIKEIYISVKYLKTQIMDYFGDGTSKGIRIHYIEEEEALGTIGALSYIEDGIYPDILVMNSDLLTNIDFEDFYNFYKTNDAKMALASVPYYVNVPYAVLQTNGHVISSFTEKPNFTYYSNGGIYLMKLRLKELFLKGTFFDATDLMNSVIEKESNGLVHYPLLGYWLDIGRHQDYVKAQEDIKHINF